MMKTAIFASGSGTNAQRIVEYFRETASPVSVEVILSNNPHAYVLERAKMIQVPSRIFTRDEFYQSETILDILHKQEVEYLILAGFLWLIPASLLKAYPDKIINIHPALLPRYGGKGMYGMKVHEAVIAAREKESGISIHLVNEKYDEGKILFQAKCPVSVDETPESLAAKVHQLEYRHFPEVIENFILGKKN